MIYQFEDFELDTDQQELRRAGEILKIEPQVFALLALLVSNHDRLVSKDEVHEVVWAGRIVSESAVNSRLASARTVIGDDGTAQRLIKTIHKRGFRFVGDVEIVHAEKNARESPPPSNLIRIHQWKAAAVVAGALVVGVVFFYLQNPSRDTTDAHVQTLVSDAKPYIGSIAVLPFRDMSAAGDEGYFAEGISEELLNVLASVNNLKVSSRTSAFAPRESDLGIREIADILGVDHVLEGSVRKAGSTLRITVQLIDAKTDSHIFSDNYDVILTAENVLQIQDKIAAKIVAKLSSELELPRAKLAPRIASLDAYEHYLTARDLMRERKSEPVLKSIDLLKQTLAIDPNYAPAYAELVEAYYFARFYAGLSVNEATAEMRKNVDRAMALAPDRPETLAAAGTLAVVEGRHEDALDLFDSAIAAGPNYAIAHKRRADTLAHLGRLNESLVAYDKALVYDPVSPIILSNAGASRLAVGDFAGALEAARANIKWNGNTPVANQALARLMRFQGDYAEAHRLLNIAASINSDDRWVQIDLARLYNDIGLDDRAFSVAKAPSIKAMFHALSGDRGTTKELIKLDLDAYTSAYANYLLADYESAYRVFRIEVTGYDLAGERPLGADEPTWLAEMTYVLNQKEDPDADILLQKLEAYYGDKPPSEFLISDELIGAAALHMMRGNQEEALEWLDAAIDQGHAYLTLTRRPVFAPLADHPKYPARLARMEENAQRHRAAIEMQLAAN